MVQRDFCAIAPWGEIISSKTAKNAASYRDIPSSAIQKNRGRQKNKARKQQGPGERSASPAPGTNQASTSVVAGTGPGSAIPAFALRFAAGRDPSAAPRPARVVGATAIGHHAAPIGPRGDSRRRAQESGSSPHIGAVRAFRLGRRDCDNRPGSKQGCAHGSMEYLAYKHAESPFHAFFQCRKQRPAHAIIARRSCC